ncbi:MAG: winged helix-turn-helix transcriptional regulator, partial [Acidimicrobiales bacterium]|nr:winged helix-turn-helix transcriptional regulator [Acidimicrobiales bacterium]
MDEIDRAILHHIQADGRLPNNELADLVGLSPSPCLRRVRKLEADGVIQGYVAVLDRQA